MALNLFLIYQRSAAWRSPQTFQEIVDSLPDDWTDLELDLRIFDERRYVDAATLLVVCYPQPYSRTTGTGGSWWRTASATPRPRRRCTPALKLLDEAGIEGELAVREVRAGRTEIAQMWGRPESVRQEFKRIRAQ